MSLLIRSFVAGEIPNEEANPRIVKVSFSMLSEEAKARASKLGDHGTLDYAKA
jgi:hypothetical protein